MEENSSVFSYLGEDMMQQQLAEISNSLQQCFDPGSQQFQNLAKYTKKLARKREKWPEKIFATWRNRKVPVYSPESITKCNQARVSQIEFANEQRKRLQTSYLSDINRCKKKLDDVSKKRDTCEEKYNEQALSSQAQLQLLNPRDVIQRVKLSTFLRSAWDSYAWTVQRLVAQEQTHWDELTMLEGELAPIRLVSTQSNQKHLVVPKGNSLVGWLPGEDEYVMIQQSKVPHQDEIFRHISFEPESGLSNLPLSIYNLIGWADEIGCTDNVLLTMLTMYLKKYKPSILDVIDTKKRSIAAIIEILAHHCSTEPEKQAVLLKLKHFKREPMESFASAVIRFESLYVFWLQLDTPHSVDSIRLMSYEVLRNITQYLLSPKCATAFGKWTQEQVKLGGKIDKDVIIRTVSQLESYAELKLHSARTLPGIIITTTLGLPAGPAEQTVNALFVNPPKPVDMRSPSTGRPRTPSTAARPRPPSNGARPQTTAPRGPSADKQHPNRRQSQSPRRGQQPVARGRSPGKVSSSSSSYSAEIELDPALECLQYYSRYSTSPNEVRKQSVPGIFRRPLTPKSKEHMKKTYFYATSGDTRFKDVRQKGYCLRCYGSNHRANLCKVYTRPTPTPCRQCMHLFHPTELCKFYHEGGTSRPASGSRSSSQGK
jgi:hypothetical protein